MWIVEFESNIFTKSKLDNFGGVWRVFGHLIHKEVGLGYITKYVTSTTNHTVPRKKKINDIDTAEFWHNTSCVANFVSCEIPRSTDPEIQYDFFQMT